MLWGKKDNKASLPELPPISMNDISKIDSEDDSQEDDFPPEKHNLPAFPDNPTQKGFSQSAIKEAVNTDEDLPPEEFPINKKFETVEVGEEFSKPTLKMPPIPQGFISQSIPVFPQARDYNEAPLRRKQEKSSEIFVKIDKFHSAKRTLETIKGQISEVDETLKKIRETKLREEQELTAWEKELESIKIRIKDVTENIFEKVE